VEFSSKKETRHHLIKSDGLVKVIPVFEYFSTGLSARILTHWQDRIKWYQEKTE
jgi:hypothetical protein